MARIEAYAVSFRPRQIRLSDVAPQIGDARNFVVHLLDRAGVRGTLHVELAEKWGGSWRWELRCQKCLGPVRVLHLEAELAVCNRCSRYLTPHQRHKRSNTWTAEGALADRLMKTAQARQPSVTQRRGLAKQLQRNTAARAYDILQLANRMIQAADELPGRGHRHRS